MSGNNIGLMGDMTGQSFDVLITGIQFKMITWLSGCHKATRSMKVGRSKVQNNYVGDEELNFQSIQTINLKLGCVFLR
jgi:hypothetical protein